MNAPKQLRFTNDTDFSNYMKLGSNSGILRSATGWFVLDASI